MCKMALIKTVWIFKLFVIFIVISFALEEHKINAQNSNFDKRSAFNQDQSGRNYYSSSNFKRFRRGYGPRDESQFGKVANFGTFRKDPSGGRKGSSRAVSSRNFNKFGGPDAVLVSDKTERVEIESKNARSFASSSNAFPKFGNSYGWGEASKGRSKGGGYSKSVQSPFSQRSAFDSGSSHNFGISSNSFGSSSNNFDGGKSFSNGFNSDKDAKFQTPFGNGGRPTGQAGFSSNRNPFTKFRGKGSESNSAGFSGGQEIINFGNFGSFSGKIKDMTGGKIVGPLKDIGALDLRALLNQFGPTTTKKPKRVVSSEDRDKVFSGDATNEQTSADAAASANNFMSLKFPEIAELKKACSDQPTTPLNAALTCTPHSKCMMACNPGFQTRKGDATLFLNCNKGKWTIMGSDSTYIPNCEPICDPSCQHGGICLKPSICVCTEGWEGHYCEKQKKEQCLEKPPVPLHSKILCGRDVCIAECSEGYEFENKEVQITFNCKKGQWTMKNSVSNKVPNCRAVCDPPCLNEGICLSPNLCECINDFRGHLCQYPISNCDPKKMNFNGGYNCSGLGMEFGCRLWCPKGIEFKSPPSLFYTCNYVTSLWNPSIIPECDYNKKLPKTLMIEPDATPKPGICFIWSGSHYKSFDGKVFSFNSDCPYRLHHVSTLGTFSVDFVPDENCDKLKCQKFLKIFTEGDEYILENSGNNNPILTYGENTLVIPGQINGLISERVGNYVILRMLGIGLTLKWDLKDTVIIEVNELLWGKTSGLCGRLDGSTKNDWSYDDGTVEEDILSFLKNWRANSFEEMCEYREPPITRMRCLGRDNEEAENFCGQLLFDPRFETCRTVVDATLYFETCKWDYCNCKTYPAKDCSCESYAAFFRECTNKGGAVIGGWRSKDLCEMKCTGNRVYKPCMPAIQARCGQAGETTKPEFCVEGCVCKPRFLLNDEGNCVEPSKCPCTHRNQVYQPGARINNICNTCICNDGEWVCTEVKCDCRCSAVGDPHYTSYDGKKFDFMGKCSYYMAKGENFSIEQENVACGNAINKKLPKSPSNLPSCTKSLTMRIPGTTVIFKQGLQIIVNGEEITKLPLWANDIYIKKVSSIYITAQLPNGIEVWWDGKMTVHIDLPGNLRGSAGGLCGTFNDNQKDDFRTPEGDIEFNPVSFGNKWKTTDSCVDIPMQNDVPHPCDRHIQNKNIAEKYCSKLMKDIFSRCHLVVDPDPFYRNCLYDVCSCETDVKECMCPILANYGEECAAKGLFLNWRNKVRECGIHCTGDQVYQICGDSCAHTCLDIATNPSCKKKCVDGCNCQEGFSLDLNDDCIPISNCPCVHEGKEYKPGFKMLQLKGGESKQLCHCVRGTWQCRDSPIDQPPVDQQENCSDLDNEIYTDCMPEEEISCLTMHLHPEKPSADVCRSGCRCDAGFVRHKETKKCIKAKDCPCHHGGKSYKEGDNIIDHCNTCTCQESLWSCTNKICPAICTAWGSSHYKTFDGRIFDYNGMCDYMLAKGRKSISDQFQISVQNVPCGTNGVTCAKTLILRVGTGENQEVIEFSRNKPIKHDKNLKRTIIREAGIFVIAEVTDMGLELQWDKGTRAYIILSSSWKGQRVQGLCGNYNDNEQDDLRTPSGGIEVSAKIFGDSWRIQNYCPESSSIRDTCVLHPERKDWATEKCAILTSHVFSKCHSEVDVKPYLERCLFDSCGCDTGGDCECLCTAIAAYAQECNVQGVYVRWRTPEICPMQCDETCEHYEPCIPTCPSETCDSYKEPPSTLCRQDACVEGCAKNICQPGTVHKSAIERKCVDVHECENICLEIDGEIYVEGEVISEDHCHKCYCSKSKKICRGTKCVTAIEPVFTQSALLFSEKTTYIPVVTTTSTLTTFVPACSQFLNVTRAPHEMDCQMFYECATNELMKCETGTLYNTKSYDCDRPEVVYAVRTECRVDPPDYVDVRDVTPKEIPEGMYQQDGSCPLGQYNEYKAISCIRVCKYYSHFLMQEGLCPNEEDEAPACVDENTGQACPTGFFLMNNSTCASKANCNCILPNGMSATNEINFLVADCELCKCSDNKLTCDNTECFGKDEEEQPMNDEWSPWRSVSAPSGEGDDESLDLLRRRYRYVCVDPSEIECRIKDPLERHYKTKQKVICDTKTGFICLNEENPDGCKDYETRIKCTYDEEMSTTSVPPKITPTFPPLDGCKKPYWTEWFNVTHPYKKGGDYELLDVIFRDGHKICPKDYVTHIECAFLSPTISDSYELVDYTLSDDIGVTCSKLFGLTCANVLQAGSKKCHDYAIKVRCECYAIDIYEKPDEKPKILDIIPSLERCDAGFENLECSLPCNKACMFYKHYLKTAGECQDESKCTSACMAPDQISPCPQGQYMSDKMNCVEIEDCDCRLSSGQPLPGGSKIEVSRCEWCSCKNNVLTCIKDKDCERIWFGTTSAPITTTQYTTSSQISSQTTTEIESSSQIFDFDSLFGCNKWSPWLNMKRTPEGDFQRISDIRDKYHDFCERPSNISCRDSIAKIPYEELDQSVTCSVDEGFICRNEDNVNVCYDYEVCFYCHCEEDTSTQESTSMLVTIQPIPCDGWSPWINEHKPWLENGDIEYKTLDQLRDQYSFCIEGQINDIECEQDGSGLNVTVNKEVRCDKRFGLKCINAKQDNGLCFDFKIRYYCSCEIATTTRTAIIVPTVTPTSPLVCDPKDYIDLLKDVPDSAFSATSSAGSQYSPANAAKLNTINPIAYAGGAWMPATNDTKPYLQIDLGEVKTIYGFYVAGSASLPSARVTSYTAISSDDQILWNKMSSKRLQGAFADNKKNLALLPKSVEARWIQLNPASWSERIAMRVEVVGCSVPTPSPPTRPPICNDEMGLQNGELHDDQISVSSVYLDLFDIYGKQRSRLNTKSVEIGSSDAWVAKNLPNQFIRFNFLAPRKLTGIVTQGSSLANYFVQSYSVRYSHDEQIWNSVLDYKTGKDKIFFANDDSTTSVENSFDRIIEAQYLELKPLEWHDGIAMRIEIKGCYRPYPPISPTTTAVPAKLPPPHCDICPGLPEQYYKKCYNCYMSQLFNGNECVPAASCPCFYKNMIYKRGSVFETNDCQECTCETEGNLICIPMECSACNKQEERAVLLPTCRCICKPCPENTKLCPSSGLCLDTEKWCNGIENCPDDELYCPTECPSPDCPVEWKVTVQMKGDNINCPVYKCIPPDRTTPMMCPLPFCPFGLHIVIVPRKMGEACPKYKCESPTTTVKPFTCPPITCPPGYEIPVTSLKESYKGCPQYKCTAKMPVVEPCPPPSCPLGYDISYSSEKAVLDLCPEYKCHQIMTTTACPPVICPNGMQIMFIQSDNEDLCSQYTCVRISQPLDSTTALPTVPPCPEVVLPICSPDEEIYQIKGERCPVFKCKKIVKPTLEVGAHTIGLKGVCKVIGKRFTTFDGSEFQMIPCEHILARNTAMHKWQISRLQTCQDEINCVLSLNITLDETSIILNSDSSVQLDGHRYTAEQAQKIGRTTDLFSVSKIGDSIVYTSNDGQLKVVLDKNSNTQIKISNDQLKEVDGLCGLYDGSSINDRTMSDGSLSSTLREFGESWLIGDKKCMKEAQKCTTEESKKSLLSCIVLNSKPFTECHDVIPPTNFLKGCVDHLCSCLKESSTNGMCKCGVISAYISSCLEKKPDAKIAEWRIASKCYRECPKGEEYSDCYKFSCEKSCNNLNIAGACEADNNGICVSGCFCEPGLVRKGSSCVTPDQCRDCTCDVFSASHFSSFDGRNFSISGICTFVVSRDIGHKRKHKFQILATTEKCATTSSMCITKLEILIGDIHKVEIIVNEFEAISVSIDEKTMIERSHQEEWIILELPDNDQVKLSLPEIPIEVSYSKEVNGFTVKNPSYLFGGKLEGLCGNCNSYPNDDITTSKGNVGKSIEKFGKSWAVEETECELSLPDMCKMPENDPCLELLDKSVFGKCHPLIDPAAYIHSCRLEFCAFRDDQSAACLSFAAYAKKCLEIGVCIDYRTENRCPKSCPHSFQYKACGETCTKTCDNYEQLKKDPLSCSISLTDGCYCPIGMVLDNEVCVDEKSCIVCDEEGHRVGEVWDLDSCTTCECKTDSGIICATKSCPLEPVCLKGYRLEEVLEEIDDCCGPRKKCILIILKGCTDPVAESCDFGKQTKLIEAPGECPHFVCVCFDPKDCPDPMSTMENERELENGEKWELEITGCCPKYAIICTRDCQQKKCSQFYELVKVETTRPQCCEEYKCELPKDSCISEPRFKIESGFERPLLPKEKAEPKLYKIWETWLDGLCIKGECVLGKNGKATTKYVKDSCQKLKGHRDETDYKLKEILLPNQCCPQIVRKSCIIDGATIKPNETFNDPTNGCRSVTCKLSENGNLEKVEHHFNCDINCPLGWEYKQSILAPIICCGQCQQVSCDYEGTLRAVGDKWRSEDYCTDFECIESDTDNKIRIHSKDVQCTEPSVEDKRLYLFQKEKNDYECCDKYTREKCIFSDQQTMKVGEEKKYPENNCLKVICEISVDGNVNRREIEQDCSDICPQGHEYMKPDPDSEECCGQCLQTQCVDDKKVHQIGDTWKNPDDICYQYKCQLRHDDLTVVATKKDCPYFDVDCPKDKILSDPTGCCKICNVTKKECEVQEIKPEETVEMFIFEWRSVGRCTNEDPVHGFKRCIGKCDSTTVFKAEGIEAGHVSQCDCCGPSKMSQISVNLKCNKGYTFVKVFQNIETCECQPCKALQNDQYLNDQQQPDLTEFNPSEILEKLDT